jgi:acyl-CoA thioester hydrolase
MATWILPAESRLCISRRFQLRRAADDATLMRAEVQYACIELSSGRPTRWPKEFRAQYVPITGVANAASSLAPI